MGVSPIKIRYRYRTSVFGVRMVEDRQEIRGRIDRIPHGRFPLARIGHVRQTHAVITAGIRHGVTARGRTHRLHPRIIAQAVFYPLIIFQHGDRVALGGSIVGGGFRQEAHFYLPDIRVVTSGGETTVIDLHEEVIHHVPRQTKGEQQLHAHPHVATPAVHQLYPSHFPHIFLPSI